MNFLLSILLTAIVGVGNYSTIVSGRDTLMVFPGEIELRTNDGTNADWYSMRSGIRTSWGTSDSRFCQSGERVLICRKGQTKPFAIRRVYTEADIRPRNLGLEVTPECEKTTVRVLGEFVDSVRIPGRLCFRNLSWSNSEMQWVEQDTCIYLDSIYAGVITKKRIPAFLATTTFRLLLDSVVSDSVVTEEIRPIAAAYHPTWQVEARWNEGDKMNEIDGPNRSAMQDAKQIVGNSNTMNSGKVDVFFTANGTEAVMYYQWQVKQSETILATRKVESHRYSFDEESYTVTVSASGSQCPCKCTSDTVFLVSVAQSELLIPNAFSPNGDGVNDEFRVAYKSIREFHCWVYDRWGHLVYKWDNPAKGWDGTTNGRPASVGAYYYVIRATGTDGRSFKYSGDINLLR